MPGIIQNDPWTFTDVTGNYNSDSGMVHDHINRAAPTVGVTFTPNSITYDANAHVASATVTGVSGTLAVPANGNLTIRVQKERAVFAGTPTDAASYTASAHFASSNSNYNDADSTVDASLIINKANTRDHGDVHTESLHGWSVSHVQSRSFEYPNFAGADGFGAVQDR